MFPRCLFDPYSRFAILEDIVAADSPEDDLAH